MLKTRRDGLVWLITQPAHGELAGRLAAHWGNEAFAAPGAFATSTDPERLRREVVLAIAQHDNGWWEWEADPPLSDEDGLPQGLAEVLRDPEAGMDRWRLGVPRLAERHPYAALLIGDHAHWLYAAQFTPNAPAEFTHQLQLRRRTYPSELATVAHTFLADVRRMQDELRRRLRDDPFWRRALESVHRHPHLRLLQTLDALSLALCSAAIPPIRGDARGLGDDHVEFPEVPRRRWEDRGPLTMIPTGDGRIVLDPYPFDVAPLSVTVPARVAEPYTWWPRAQHLLREFTFEPASSSL